MMAVSPRHESYQGWFKLILPSTVPSPDKTLTSFLIFKLAMATIDSSVFCAPIEVAMPHNR